MTTFQDFHLPTLIAGLLGLGLSVACLGYYALGPLSNESSNVKLVVSFAMAMYLVSFFSTSL